MSASYEALMEETLRDFVSGAITWRSACSTLGLWHYDELYSLLKENGLSPPLPHRGTPQEVRRMVAVAQKPEA